jgi:hypothetical protein
VRFAIHGGPNESEGKGKQKTQCDVARGQIDFQNIGWIHNKGAPAFSELMREVIDKLKTMV